MRLMFGSQVVNQALFGFSPASRPVGINTIAIHGTALHYPAQGLIDRSCLQYRIGSRHFFKHLWRPRRRRQRSPVAEKSCVAPLPRDPSQQGRDEMALV